MFDWDDGNINHIKKHGITPKETEEVILNDPMDLRFELRNGEERTVQVGETDKGRILVVVTTMRGELIRVITAFSATKNLRKVYITQRTRANAGGTEESELQE